MKRLNSRLISALLAAVVLSASVLTGCGSKEPSTTGANTPATQAPTDSAVPETIDPLGKYTPEVTVNLATYTNTTVKYREGESAENNVWMKAYKDILGIDVKYKWIVDEAQFTQKMNASIASDDLPDIFPVTGQQFNSLVEAGSLEDLTDAYEKYASSVTTGIVNQDAKFFELGKKDGKLYGLPYSLVGTAYDVPPMLFVREDWRKKLNLPEPKTLDDFYKIEDAFVNQDPDGNGKNDTYALALTKTLARGDSGVGAGIQGVAGLQGLANAYHAYLATWIKDSSGKIVYGSIQPEVKTLLLKLQEMYKNGWIDKEFAVKDMNKSAELLANGKVGMEFGLMWNPIYPLVMTVENNKDADWKAYPIPSIDDKPAKAATNVTVSYYWVVRKGFEKPEAIVKMLNLFTEKCFSNNPDPNMYMGDGKTFTADGSIYSPFKYAFIQAWPAMKNLNQHKAVVAAIKSNDPSKLDTEGKTYYDQIQAYLTKGDIKTGWGPNKVFGEDSTYVVIDKYVNENLLMYDEYHGAPTETMVEKGATLDKMENEVFTNIIMGASIDEFDKFVENWKKLGGDAITEELNKAAQ